MRVVSFMRHVSALWLSLALASVEARAQSGDEALIGIWAAEKTFAAALAGPLEVRREGQQWRAMISGAEAPCQLAANRLQCVFSDGRGQFRGTSSGDKASIAGWWLRPSGETADRSDPGGSGQPFATRVDLERTGDGRWRGTVEPLTDRFTLYLNIFRNTNEIDGVAEGELVAVFRNPEINSTGGSSYYNVSRQGRTVHLLRKVPDGREIRHEATLMGTPQHLRIVWPDVGPLELTRRTPAEARGFYPRPPGEPAYSYRRPPETGDSWKTARASEVAMDEGALTALVQSLIDANPSSRRPALIHSMLVAHRGKLVLEEYFRGYDRNTPHDMRSAGKTFASVMLGAVMLQGVRISPDSRIYDVLADRGPFANPDPRKAQITLAHLMTHSSGLDCDDNNEKSLGNEGTMTAQPGQPDWWKYTLDLPQVHDPGKRYAYCSANTNLVGGALTVATATWLPELFDRTVGRPLQFGRYHWPTTPTDEGYLGGGSFLLPRDFLKVGQTWLDGGVWNGKRIVSVEWVAQSTAPRIEITPATTGLSEEEFANNYGVGADAYTWHLNELHSGGRTYKEYEASGNGGQLLIVVPDADLAVVFTAGNYLQGGIWSQWRQTIVADRIIPAIRK